MNPHAKWLRQAAKIAVRAKLVNIANTCEQAAAEIDRLSALTAMPEATRSHKEGPRCDGHNCAGHPFNCYAHPYDCGCSEQSTAPGEEVTR